jgi:hypothetical protein
MSPSNEKMVTRRVFLRSASLAALSVVALSSFIKGAEANVPTILQVENISQGSMGRIRLQISHANPSSSHYVDLVEADVNGQVTPFSLQPQNSDPFTVELDLGQVQGTPNVRARAHCITHGWSDWSSQVSVPEFPATAVAVFMALAASLFMIRNTKKS